MRRCSLGKNQIGLVFDEYIIEKVDTVFFVGDLNYIYIHKFNIYFYYLQWHSTVGDMTLDLLHAHDVPFSCLFP